jgi:hypothetical protein
VGDWGDLRCVRGLATTMSGKGGWAARRNGRWRGVTYDAMLGTQATYEM